ncbi:uncharacterized protein LOC119829070 isoform X2 [Zerene cesonia]|uniref:uncharacterized protein LOC119829070 isoform X2 n=1 Tax=Zerene cesonia TaxID=33412 RepID=UPI0018E59F59|nr:uncharacterized protein LOC119829070 isoform X2 [Zerene cesonia]
MENVDSDQIIEHWLQNNDISGMSLPDIEYEPHLLISKIKDLKRDTNNGKLYKKLSECLKKPPENEKKIQTTLTMSKDCTCTCTCYQRKKVCKLPEPNSMVYNNTLISMDPNKKDIHNMWKDSEIPKGLDTSYLHNGEIDFKSANAPVLPESHDAEDVMQQLEKLFEGGSNEDDIFDGILCNSVDITFNEGSKMSHNYMQNESSNTGRDSLIEEQAAQIKSLDARLSTLSGVLENSIHKSKTEAVKHRKPPSNKWLCEEYFLKVRLFELLDQLRDCNRAKLKKIKVLLADLFGEDSDDEGVVSPLDETPEFVTSCKERIAPWVVKLLTPYYIKGRIKGKALFKALAKHLIRLIYQCSRYPEEYEVHNFIKDFLHNHKTIRCEADFKQFRIENI